MNDKTTAAIGKIITDPSLGRDAVHVAVVPVEAGETLTPGDRVVLDFGKAINARFVKTPAIGIVDPFLDRPVNRGEKFFLFLFPGTITSLRHVWSHPAFVTKAPPALERTTRTPGD